MSKKLSFQEIIFRLNKYWSDQGCVILQSHDVEVGAGTLAPWTVLRTLGDKPWNVAYVQPSRRPADGRYGENPNRMQMFNQYQVVLKPSPPDAQEVFLGCLRALGLNPDLHDIRFVEDDWENPTVGAWGLGWEVWCDGMEITQFTYFQQVGGLDCKPAAVEYTLGLERLAMYLQDVDNVFDLDYNGQGVTYGEVYHRNEREMSAYNFDYADVDRLLRQFEDFEVMSKDLNAKKLALPAYENAIKASHIFNVLDARGVVGATERPTYVSRIRDLVKAACETYINEEGA